MNRKRSGPDRILATIRGYLHADGYGGYDDYVISSAVRNDLNPWAYLNDLFCRLPDLGEAPTREQLLPFLADRWKPAAETTQSGGTSRVIQRESRGTEQSRRRQQRLMLRSQYAASATAP